MSCNDLPVDGHASMLSPPLRLWQLTMVWTLLLVDNTRLRSTTARVPLAAFFFFLLPGRELWLFPWEKRYQVGWWFWFSLLFPHAFLLLLLFSLNYSFKCLWGVCSKARVTRFCIISVNDSAAKSSEIWVVFVSRRLVKIRGAVRCWSADAQLVCSKVLVRSFCLFSETALGLN